MNLIEWFKNAFANEIENGFEVKEKKRELEK